jgi:hypothetical protein
MMDVIHVWWVVMSGISLFNIVVLVVNLVKPQHASHSAASDSKSSASSTRYQRWMRLLAIPYVLGCALRATMPRIDGSRICFFDSWLSSTVVGRSVATVAELAFFAQLALATEQLARDLALLDRSFRRVYRIQRKCCVLAMSGIVLAEYVSWIGVLTTNQLWHCIEESLWLVCTSVLAVCCAVLRSKAQTMQANEFDNNNNSSCASGAGSAGSVGSAGSASTFLRSMVVCSSVYAVYMALLDIPLYYARYVDDSAIVPPVRYLTVAQGLFDASYCHIVSQSIDVWQHDVVWMTLYFSLCVWASLWLMRAPTFATHHQVRNKAM